MDKITSKNNKLVKDIKKLVTSSRARKQTGLFVLEGARLCFDVLNSVYKVETVLITENTYEKYAAQAEKLILISNSAYIINEEVSEKLSDTEKSQGIFCVCKLKNENCSIKGEKLIALDGVSDPSNLGAILRSAESLGIETVILYNSCDAFNPKALRASMGSTLRINIVEVESLEKALKKLKNYYKVYSTVPNSSAEDITKISFKSPSICVIGNEANGVEKNIIALSDKLITIKMKGRAESLNASAAAAITMWEMLR